MYTYPYAYVYICICTCTPIPMYICMRSLCCCCSGLWLPLSCTSASHVLAALVASALSPAHLPESLCGVLANCVFSLWSLHPYPQGGIATGKLHAWKLPFQGVAFLSAFSHSLVPLTAVFYVSIWICHFLMKQWPSLNDTYHWKGRAVFFTEGRANI